MGKNNLMNKIVYSYISGDYETQKNHEIISKGWDYLSLNNFTNEHSTQLTPRLQARYVKIKFFKSLSTDISMWIDGSIKIRCDLNKFLEEISFEDFDLAVMKHRFRNSIKEEANECLRIGKGDRKKITNQINKYNEAGYKFDNGLAETGILIRKHSNRVKDFCDLWWNELKNHSERDQLSFNYCLWKHPLKVKYIEPKFWLYPKGDAFNCLPEDFSLKIYREFNEDISHLNDEQIKDHFIKSGQFHPRIYSEKTRNTHFNCYAH